METLDRGGNDWRPLWMTFGEGFGNDLKQVMPDIEVNTARIRQRPTASDPLGTKPRLRMELLNDQLLVRIFIDDECSPWMEASVLQTWLIVDRPDLFRRVQR